MRRYTGRLIATALTAVAGTTFGRALHRRMAGDPDGGAGSTPSSITPPVANSLIATGVGMLFGRRAWLAAFAVGTVLTAFTGSALDEKLFPSGQSPSASETSSLQSSE